jgi:hypothetical protein
MAVMTTDPWTSAGGQKQFMKYNNVAAHKSNAGGQTSTTTLTTTSASSGWVLLNASGTLQLNAIVNASQTVADKEMAAGSYDSLRFYVDYAIVTYNDKNYTSPGPTQVTAAIDGSAQVSSGSTTAVLFDMRTIIVNAGSSSSPNFVFTSSARAGVVSSGDVDSSSLQVGARTDLSAKAWFRTFVSGNAHLVITASSISGSSLSVTVKDTGSESSNVGLVIVTPVSILGSASVVIPGALDGSVVFYPVTGGTTLQSTSYVNIDLGTVGTTISSSSSSTFTYNGSIQFGIGLQSPVVVSGQSYLITVIGSNSVASSTVTAS